VQTSPILDEPLTEVRVGEELRDRAGQCVRRVRIGEMDRALGGPQLFRAATAVGDRRAAEREAGHERAMARARTVLVRLHEHVARGEVRRDVLGRESARGDDARRKLRTLLGDVVAQRLAAAADEHEGAVVRLVEDARDDVRHERGVEAAVGAEVPHEHALLVRPREE